MQLWQFRDERRNPISGPLLDEYFSRPENLQRDHLAPLPNPYNLYVQLIYGYQYREKLVCSSPTLSNDKIPVGEVRGALSHPPYSSKETRKALFLKPFHRGDTIYFNAIKDDEVMRDSTFSQIIELMAKYTYLGNDLLPTKPRTKATVDHPFIYLFIANRGKVIFSNLDNDSSKLTKVYESGSANEELYKMYCRGEDYSLLFPRYLKRVFIYQWELFGVLLVGLVMLLRGETIREWVKIRIKRK